MFRGRKRGVISRAQRAFRTPRCTCARGPRTRPAPHPLPGAVDVPLAPRGGRRPPQPPEQRVDRARSDRGEREQPHLARERDAAAVGLDPLQHGRGELGRRGGAVFRGRPPRRRVPGRGALARARRGRCRGPFFSPAAAGAVGRPAALGERQLRWVRRWGERSACAVPARRAARGPKRSLSARNRPRVSGRETPGPKLPLSAHLRPLAVSGGPTSRPAAPPPPHPAPLPFAPCAASADRSASSLLSSAVTRFSATAMNSRVAGEGWALRRVMNAEASCSGGSNATPERRRAAARGDDRAVASCPRGRAGKVERGRRYSTSISGSIFTPARWARSRSWRRMGSSAPQRAS